MHGACEYTWSVSSVHGTFKVIYKFRYHISTHPNFVYVNQIIHSKWPTKWLSSRSNSHLMFVICATMCIYLPSVNNYIEGSTFGGTTDKSLRCKHDWNWQLRCRFNRSISKMQIATLSYLKILTCRTVLNTSLTVLAVELRSSVPIIF